MTTHFINRRDFLRRTGQGAALAGLGMMAAAGAQDKPPVETVDPHAPKTGRLLAPDEIVGLGIIGVGGMGGGHVEELCALEKGGLKIQLRAVADVYTKRREYRKRWVKSNVGRDNIDAYADYKEMLARDDIHGVVIATPDHWHAQMCLDAMDAGKDVYCQKPVTLTAEEAILVRDKVRATGRIFQCGAQGCSTDWWWQARAFIKKGGIGRVLWAQADYSRNSAGGPEDRGGEWNYTIDEDSTNDPNAGDAYIDWDRWLGPAPKRPFSKPRFFQFRKYWDYSGGVATDLLYHLMAPMTIALDAQAPERIVGSGGIYVQRDDREVPDTFVMTCDYPDDYTVVLSSCMANRQAAPTIIRGHKATIRPGDNGAMKVTAEDEFKEWFKKEFGAEELIVAPETRMGHMENWVDAMHTRGATHCDAETALRAMVGIKLGVESYRQDKVMFWDNAAERCTDTHPRPDRAAKVPVEKA